MTLEQLAAKVADHILAGRGELEVEVETERGYPPVSSLEIVETTLGIKAVLLT